MQLFSSSLYSLGHGGNDAQKTVGIIWMLLIAAGYTGANDPVPAWVPIACYVTIGFGTLFGGWRIVKTMGQRITKVRPVGGFCAEIDRLESDADRVMRAAVSKLFREENDVKQVLKLRMIYDLLETITDRCEDVANVVEGIVLENS